jgi:hypothetical protein
MCFHGQNAINEVSILSNRYLISVQMTGAPKNYPASVSYTFRKKMAQLFTGVVAVNEPHLQTQCARVI